MSSVSYLILCTEFYTVEMFMKKYLQFIYGSFLDNIMSNDEILIVS